MCTPSLLRYRRVALDKDKGFVKHKNPGRCVSTADFARGVEDQSSGIFTLHHLFSGRRSALPTIDTASNYRP